MNLRDDLGFVRGARRDRAAVAATAVIRIVSDALCGRISSEGANLPKARAAVEEYLRDEFEDLAREVRGERDVIDP